MNYIYKEGEFYENKKIPRVSYDDDGFRSIVIYRLYY